MKRAAVALIALALVAGCSGDLTTPTTGKVSDPEQNLNGYVYVDTIPLPDGREVLCVGWKRMNAGGLSCDWDNAHEVTP